MTQPQPSTTPGELRRLLPLRSGLMAHSAAVLLAMLLLLFVSAPFAQDLPRGNYIDTILVTLVLGAAAMAVGGGRRTLIPVVLVAAPALVSRWINLVSPGLLPGALPPAAYLLFVALVVLLFLRFILLAPRVNSEVLCAAVSTYLLLALMWGAAYAMVGRIVPGSFVGLPAGRELLGFDALYFSIITITTVGYGDIAPASGPARMLAMIEAVTGTMYVAMIVARLVSLYTVEAASKARREERPQP